MRNAHAESKGGTLTSVMIRVVVSCMFVMSAPVLAQKEAGAKDPVDEAKPPIATLQEIVIVGTRSERPLAESPVQVQVIKKEDIAAAADTNAADAVSRIVGVHIDTTVRTGSSPQIQGFGSKHVLVLIDGRRANGRLADDFDLSRIPASQIERIEVLKGASSILYGSDAIGGVINIVTKRPAKGFAGELTVSRDSLHRDEAAFGLSAGNDYVRARIDASHQRGPSFDIDANDAGQTGYGFERSNGTLNLEVSATNRLKFITMLSSEDSGSEGIAVGSGGAVLDRTSKGRGRSGAVGAVYEPSDASEIRMEFGESQRVYGFKDDQRDADRLDRRLDSEEQSRDTSVIASHSFSAAHETVAGVEYADQEFVSNQMSEGPRERQRTNAFLQHEWEALDNVTLVPGVRHDDDSQFGGQLSKALAIRSDIGNTVVVRASYGEGYRAPSFSELYLRFENLSSNYQVQGNPDLQPESSRNYQLNASWEPDERFWFSVGVFENRVRDLIATIRTQPTGVLLINYANVDKVLSRGVEASGRWQFERSLSLGLDYTFLDAMDEVRKRALEGRPMHSGVTRLRYDHVGSGFNAALSMNLVGKRPYYIEERGTTRTEWAKSYRSVGVRFGKTLGERLELFAGGRNLTDENQETYHPVPPRSWFGGATATF